MRIAPLAFLAATLAAPLLAQTASAQTASAQTAPARSAEVPSKGIAARSTEVDAKVADLTHAIRWHTSLDEAEAAARSSGKPIFWMHMLGDLAGST
jgi:hypothetical protein